MNELINKLNEYRSMGDRFYPEDIVVTEDIWALIDEIERLNNIINELDRESYLGMIENKNNNDYAKGLFTAYKYINDKIKELKGSDKE